jgi:hypothetical protein
MSGGNFVKVRRDSMRTHASWKLSALEKSLVHELQDTRLIILQTSRLSVGRVETSVSSKKFFWI